MKTVTTNRNPSHLVSNGTRLWGCGLVAVFGLTISHVKASDSTNAPPDIPELKKLSMEELMDVEVPSVYGASKHDQKVTDAPSSVTIITSRDIKEYGYRTLPDILQSVRGFYVTYDRSYSCGRILITVDGHRVNEPIYDQAFNGTEGIVDVDLIERVEVIRGPGSALYGDNAFFGVVNIITRRGREMNGPELSSAVASYDTYTGRASYGKLFANGLELMVSGTYLDSEGHHHLYYPEFFSVNHGSADYLDGQSVKSAFASVSYRDLSFEGALMHRYKDVPTASPNAVFDQQGNHIMDERAFFEARHQHLFPNDFSTLTRIYYDHYQFDSTYPHLDTNFPGQVIFNHGLAHSEGVGGEFQLSKVIADTHRLTAGTEFRHDFEISGQSYDVYPHQTYMDVRTSGDMVGVYGEGEFQFLNYFTLNAGVRYDHFNTFGGTVNPRIGLIFHPTKKTALKFLYGEAFRAPNASETYYTYIRNPDLGSERVRSYEVVLEQELNRYFRASSSVFVNLKISSKLLSLPKVIKVKGRRDGPE